MIDTMAPRMVLLQDSLGSLISVWSVLPPPSASQLRHMRRSPMLRQLSRLPSHQMLSLSHWLPVRQMYTLFHLHREPQPLRWIRISRPPLGPLHPRVLTLMILLHPQAKHPNTVKWQSKKNQDCWQLILCSVDFLLLFHYVSDCASFIV